MNQQEIDRLFDRYSFADPDYWKDDLLMRKEFTAAIQEATAQARQEALEEVIQHFTERAENMAATARILEERGSDEAAISEYREFAAEDRAAADCVRALAAQEQEGKHD